MAPLRRAFPIGKIGLLTLLLSILLGFFAVLHAQPPGSTLDLDTADDDIRKLLRQIDQMTADGQYEEAIERLRRLMDQRGDVLIGAAESFKNGEPAYERYVPLRDVCHARLVQWADSHPAALAEYRRRVDPLAERWFREAVDNRDAAQLERLAEQIFASSYGDDALLWLGELYLEQGRYTAARRAWERISPALRAGPVLQALDGLRPGIVAIPQPKGVRGFPLWLAIPDMVKAAPDLLTEASAAAKADGASPAYPNSDVNLADVRARLVLTSIMEGALDRAAAELEAMRRLEPEATGAIAGRSGKLVELLGTLLDEARNWTPRSLTQDWRSYAGDQQRSYVARVGVGVGASPLWRRDLPAVMIADSRFEQPWAVPAYFPIVVDEKVYVSDARGLWGFHLSDGTPLPVANEETGRLPVSVSAAEQSNRSPSLAFTLTSDGERLLARMGPPPASASRNERARRDQSDFGFLAVFNLRTYFLAFKAQSTAFDFEGAPVCDRGRLYALVRNLEGEDSVGLEAVCLDLSDGRTLWRQAICRNKHRDLFEQLPPQLLALDDDTLYACTNLGCVAAIDTADGRLRWAVEYPRAIPPNPQAMSPTAPNPCLVHQGMVIAAPADGERLLAIDAATGELLWTTERRGADQLLGVAHGNLIVGGDSLRWIDVRGGWLRGRFPQGELDERGLVRRGPRGFGRGLLAGNRVYWPASGRIYVFDQRIADTPQGPSIVSAGLIDLAGQGVESGNLAISRGVLIVASPKALVGFGEPAAP